MLHTKDITLTKKQQLFLMFLGINKQAICFSDQKNFFIRHRQNFLKIVNPLVKSKFILKTKRKFRNKYIANYYELTIDGICLMKHIKKFNKIEQ